MRDRRRRLWITAGTAVVAAIGTAIAATWITGRDPQAVRQPPPPRAGVEAITVPSIALGREMPMLVWLPESPTPGTTYPIVVLFHGQGGDESAWFHGIGIDDIAMELHRIRPDTTGDPGFGAHRRQHGHRLRGFG